MVAVRECPPLPSIDNAFHDKVGQTGVYGETVQVICLPPGVVDYVGNTETSYVTTCEISGQWSDTRSCIGKETRRIYKAL